MYGVRSGTYGSLWPGGRPHAGMWQRNKAAQPVSVKLLSVDKGKVESNNRYRFTNLKELETQWILEADNETLQKGILTVNLGPQKTAAFTVPLKKPEIKEGVEYRLLLSFRQKGKSAWAEPGFEIAWDQLKLPWERPVSELQKESSTLLAMKEVKDKLIISGREFVYVFDKNTGALT